MSDTSRVPYRGLITASAMLAMFMQTLDSTIANVALPLSEIYAFADMPETGAGTAGPAAG